MSIEIFQDEFLNIEPQELGGNGLSGNGIAGNGQSQELINFDFDSYLKTITL